MRTILAIIFMTFATQASALEEILYCTPDSTLGFDPKSNYESKNYNGQRFTLKVNFEANSMISEKIYLSDTAKCANENLTDVIYCISDFGTAIALHKKSMKYHHASIYLRSQQSDDIFVQHGTCEKF